MFFFNDTASTGIYTLSLHDAPSDLGKFTLSDIKEAPRGAAQVEVQMDVDENGILSVKATDLDGGSSESIEITNDNNRLTQEEIDRMVEEAKEFEEADRIQKEKTQGKVAFDQIAYDYKTKVNSEEYKKVMSEEDQKTVSDAVADALKWGDDTTDASKEEYDAKLKELQAACSEIMDKAKAAVDGAAKSSGSDDEEATPDAETADEAPAEGDKAAEEEDDEF